MRSGGALDVQVRRESVPRIASCVVTYNRLDYTQRCLESLLAARPPEHYLVVVDNGSTDGTRAYLETLELDQLILTGRNLFPGGATNLGWHAALESGFGAHLLHRSDNDVEYAPHWWEHVHDCFEAHEKLGQLGVLNMAEDFPDGQPLKPVHGLETVNRYWPSIGGNCVILREVWDKGVRWKPGPWAPGGQDEDVWMSRAIESLGYFHANVVHPIASNMSYGRFADHEGYYRETAAIRGLVAETSV